MKKLILFRDAEFHVAEIENDIKLKDMYKLTDCDTLDVVSLDNNIDHRYLGRRLANKERCN